jgi:hypothetical protein
MTTPMILAQQTAVTQVPAASPPPTIPAPEAFNAQGVPQTLEAVRSMRAQRSELSDQITSALRRRSNLAEEYAVAPAAQKAALEIRIQQLDERILNLEREIARTGQLIAQAPGEYLSEPQTFGPFENMRPDVTAIAVVLTIFVLMPLAVAIARLVWKRASHPPMKAIDNEMSERMRRLESGVDAIALEVERISEGQRFVTKLLADREKSRIEAPRG